MLEPLADRAVMKKEELVRWLKIYGDHKEHCGITQVIRDHRAKTDADGNKIYPDCSCGWTAISRALDKLFSMN